MICIILIASLWIPSLQCSSKSYLFNLRMYFKIIHTIVLINSHRLTYIGMYHVSLQSALKNFTVATDLIWSFTRICYIVYADCVKHLFSSWMNNVVSKTFNLSYTKMEYFFKYLVFNLPKPLYIFTHLCTYDYICTHLRRNDKKRK